MNIALHHILRKIDQIQRGLLRFCDKHGFSTFYVEKTVNEDIALNCVIREDSFTQKLVNRNVNFIQKSHNDYIYIRGTVTNECQHGYLIISIQISKAYWFVRRSTGNLSWLKEKYVFESSTSARNVLN
jgi:hypothetical protein